MAAYATILQVIQFTWSEQRIVTLQYCARQIAVQRFECDEQTDGQTYSVISRKPERTHGAVANRVQYVRVLRNGRWLTT